MPALHTGKGKRVTGLVWLVVMFLSGAACRLVLGEARIQETLSAVQAQQTAVMGTEAAFTKSFEDQQTREAMVAMTQSAHVTATNGPAVEVTPIPIQTQVEEIPGLDRRMKAAKILLFENMSASGYLRYVQEALDQAGYFYLDVGSAAGWFRSQLLSTEEWDLIIAAAEARRDFGGDIFEMIDNRVENGAAAIVEYWDYDSAPSGRADSLLSSCGVTFQSDWYEPNLRVFYWTQPDHPIFHEPNPVPSLGNASKMWEGDIGDLLKLKIGVEQPASDAVILASTNRNWKTDHGLLATCMQGRVVLQTFASHEYQYKDILPLWQNYIYQTLKNRFAATPAVVPTPVKTPVYFPATANADTTPKIDVEFTCGDAFLVKVPEPPEFKKDLFEHHAEGIFLIVELQMINQTPYPIQIWDGDYLLEGQIGYEAITLKPHKAATGYLYIDQPKHLVQDLIEPGMPWRTSLAFDVDPDGSFWSLLIRPGHEMNEQICDVRIPLVQ